MKQIAWALTFLLPIFSLAQKATITGKITEAGANKALPYSTVSLVKASDSTLVTFSRADSVGSFRMKDVAKGEYLLSASYVGYNAVWVPLSVTASEGTMNVGAIEMHDVKSLKNVTVTGRRPPVVVNNDTLEFNTENFKTPPNAVVEDMLKKMPGITIDNDGTVRMNGQRIRRVFVNGKEFFTGDPKMATKNLPADAIDKVQVFDKASDRAEFTGIDDGNSEKAINLKTKPDRNNALFGKATAGAGTDNRYDGQFNLNKFKGEQQVSVLGMANNTNRQGFSFQDVLSFNGDMMRNMKNGGGITIRPGGAGDNGLPVAGMGNNQPGVAKTIAGGVNYNNKWGKKTDVNSSYIFNDQSIETVREVNRQYLNTGNNLNYMQSGKTARSNTQHRGNLSIDHKIDSFNSVKLTTTATLQNSDTKSLSNYVSTGSVKKLNDGFSSSASDAHGLNFQSNLLYRKRFAKRGRTISANVNFAYNESFSDGSQLSDNLFYDTATGNPLFSKPIDQVIDQRAFNRSYGWTLTYTEPTWKGGLAEISAYNNINMGNAAKETMDHNYMTGNYDKLNDSLSNAFESRYTYTGAGLNFRTQRKKWTSGFGANVQKAAMKSLLNKNDEINQIFTDVLPSAYFTYKMNSFSNLRLEYTTNTRQPSVSQLQPVADVSDPLNIRKGNPALKREYMHTINLNFFQGDPATRKNTIMFISFNRTRSAIVNWDKINHATGVRTTMPVNVNGIYSIFSSASYGFPIRKLKSRIDLGTSFNYQHNIGIINDDKNIIGNMSVTPNARWSFDIDDKIDLQASARVGYNQAHYSLQKELNTNYWQQQYGLEMTNYLQWGLVVNNNFSYIRSTGRAEGYNTSVPLWNASLSKLFMKNKRGEIKVSAFDLLSQNIGNTRNTNMNYIEDIRYNVLQRYFLLTFTYSLNKSGLKGGPKAIIRTVE